MTMPPMLRKSMFILLACALSATTLLAIPVIYIWSLSGCDVHEDYQVSSPDGRWEALVAITGCHGVFLSTAFDTKLTIRDNSKGRLERLPVIFESDAAEPVTLTWIGTDALEVEIRRITEVYQSLRSYKGIHIAYRVTPNVMQNMADTESRIGQDSGILQPADQQVANRIDDDYRRYLARCRDWIRLYASD
jgi:hypothetical protein